MNTFQLKHLLVAAASLLWSFFRPAMPVALVCTLLAVADMLSAWRLGCRVARLQSQPSDAGRLKSRGIGRLVSSLATMYAAILLAYTVDALTGFLPVSVYHLTAGAIVMQQSLSILENMASSNSAPWARRLRRYLTDKSARHTD